MVKMEMSYLYELEVFPHVSSLLTSAIHIYNSQRSDMPIKLEKGNRTESYSATNSNVSVKIRTLMKN